MAEYCKANRSMTRNTKSINQSAWESCPHEQQFLTALGDFMHQSWSIVCQIREKNGLNPQYEMSSEELAQRIERVSQKLNEKYKEVQSLELQKSMLLNKSSKQSSERTSTPVDPNQRRTEETDCDPSCESS